MAEVIPIREILHARRRQQQHEAGLRCIEILEQSLRYHLDAFEQAPPHEWAMRASKLRKLGELLEYSTHML